MSASEYKSAPDTVEALGSVRSKRDNASKGMAMECQGDTLRLCVHTLQPSCRHKRSAAGIKFLCVITTAIMIKLQLQQQHGHFMERAAASILV